MRRLTGVLAALASAALLLVAAEVGNATTLSGLVEFSTNAAGDFDNLQVWNTRGSLSSGDVAFNLYVKSGDIIVGGAGSLGPFLNSGDGASTSISIPLALGANTFTFFVASGLDPTFALNLFFNSNSTTPDISVKADQDTLPTPPTPAFTANSSSSTLALDGSTAAAGAGTLIFVDGSTTVTLTDYSFSSNEVFTQDQVGNYNNVSDGHPDFVGRFTLQVVGTGPIGVPEPSSLLLLGSGLAGLGVLGQKRWLTGADVV